MGLCSVGFLAGASANLSWRCPLPARGLLRVGGAWTGCFSADSSFTAMTVSGQRPPLARVSLIPVCLPPTPHLQWFVFAQLLTVTRRDSLPQNGSFQRVFLSPSERWVALRLANTAAQLCLQGVFSLPHQGHYSYLKHAPVCFLMVTRWLHLS